MIDLEIPKKFVPLVKQAGSMADEVFRPVSRKYDLAEHTYPAELDLVSALIDGMTDSGASNGAGAAGSTRAKDGTDQAPASTDADEATGVTKPASGTKAGKVNKNGANMSSALSIMQTCRGDVGLTLSIPRQGLGNAAIAAVANDEQKERYGNRWAAMAITEPDTGSDSGNIRTTATKDGDEYVLNGEKIFVTSGERAELVVVWATLDRSLGKKAIKSFVVERSNPGLKLVRLEHKLGIRASDTAAFVLEDCRVPANDLLGDPEIRTEGGFGGAMQTFDNTRPLVAAMAVGLGRAALEELRATLEGAGHVIDYDKPAANQAAAVHDFIRLESDWEASWLLAIRAAWMADNKQPNSTEASMSKAKAGRMVTELTNKAVEIGGTAGYSEVGLLEKWARDSKILDIFEGTQQIQQLIIARRVLGKSSSELK